MGMDHKSPTLEEARAGGEPSTSARKPSLREIDWAHLDQRKFFGYGAGLFSAVTTALFPLTVLKTRQQALNKNPLGGQYTIAQIARDIGRHEGFRGFYRGFGTVILGSFPARLLFVPTLEFTKSQATRLAEVEGLSPQMAAMVGSGVGGGLASMVSQLVFVPVDVISQRLMIQGGQQGTHTRGPGGEAKYRAYRNGLQALRVIVATEGVKGLYRGFFTSVALFVPQSTLWWGSYGLYQKLLFSFDEWLEARRGGVGAAGLVAQGAAGEESQDRDQAAAAASSVSAPLSGSLAWTVAVQSTSAIAAGLTTGIITTPLDVIKTRLQVAERDPTTGITPTALTVARDLWRREGPRGFLRGMPTRMATSSIWGTVMVSTLEFLKRLCIKEDIAREMVEGGSLHNG